MPTTIHEKIGPDIFFFGKTYKRKPKEINKDQVSLLGDLDKASGIKPICAPSEMIDWYPEMLAIALSLPATNVSAYRLEPGHYVRFSDIKAAARRLPHHENAYGIFAAHYMRPRWTQIYLDLDGKQTWLTTPEKNRDYLWRRP